MSAQVSREPPPPLPGGYVLGEQVYYTGSSETFASGNRLEHGKQGEVVGPAASESTEGKGVAVRFPGNKDAINCSLNHVRRHQLPRSHPQLPAAPLIPPQTNDGGGRTGWPRAATALQTPLLRCLPLGLQ